MFGKKFVENFDLANPPVTEVSWYDAVEFCKRLSEKTGRKVRLPTEAEWEYACRAGTTTPFYTGGRLSYKQACIWPDWVDVDGTKEVPTEKVAPYQHPVSVGSYPPNPWGLYDMHGLVWQWCQDWYDPNYYKVSPADDPTGPTDPVPDGCGIKRKVLRGGSWDSFPGECRSAIRMEAREPQGLALDWGFRVVIECTPKEIKDATRGASRNPKR
jgi:formylglycine-generating enzyme required for sulfatase activity